MISVSTWTLLAVLGAGGETVLLDFTASWCGPCRMMDPVVQRLQAEGYPVRQIDIDQNPQLASQFGVSSVPCFVLVSNGREVDRVVGATTHDRLTRMFGAAQPAQSTTVPQTSEIRGQSPDRLPLGGRLRQMVGGLRGGETEPPRPSTIPPPSFDNAVQADGATAHQDGPEPPAALRNDTLAAASTGPAPVDVPAMAGSFPAAPEGNPLRESGPAIAAPLRSEAPAASDVPPEERAMAASVRLRIDDGQFFSYATGSIVSVRPGGEALILTCGHVFRDSQGRGEISVELFGPNRQAATPGRLIAYDLNRDLGLVSVGASSAIPPVSIAGPDAYVREGQRAFSIGCDRGAEPSVRESRITGVNRYLGTPNLVASGGPVVGRSGGGLFDAGGSLIGVCRAADTQADEGIYVSHQAIAAQLEEWGLGEVLKAKPATAPLAPQQTPEAPSPSASAPVSLATVSGDRPADFDYTQVPASGFRGAVSNGQAAASGVAPAPAAREPVFVVRSGKTGEHEIMVLEQPSQAFLDQLAREQTTPLPGGAQVLQAALGAAGDARLSQRDDAPVVRGQSPTHFSADVRLR